MTTSTRSRIVGALFLAAFLLYGIGSSLATNSAAASTTLAIGVGMMLLNSLAVIAIGVLVFPMVREHSPGAALAYLAARTLEGIVLGVGAIALSTGSPEVNVVAFNAAMATLGIGSLFFCTVLFRARLVPRFLAAWGLAGYAIFAAGSILELAGVAGVGLIAAIPGGLFEVAFGLWLIIRGFKR